MRIKNTKWFWPVLILVVLIILIVAISLIWKGRSSGSSAEMKSSTYTVERKDLTISITESGNVRARESEDYKSKVEGHTTIISIVPEGTNITKEDIENEKILVELDSSDLKRRLTEKEINVATVEASYIEAKEAFDIQKKQNESDLKAGEMKVKFAFMDLEKYLGDKLTAKLLTMAAEASDPNSEVDIAPLVHNEQLGGEGLQKERDLEAAITLADEKLERAKSKLYWTGRLFEKDYASQADVDGDEFEVKRLEIELEQARMSKELYERYEFHKEVAKLLSDYHEAKREFERTEAQARSKLAQAKAKHESSEARYNLQKDELKKIQDQLAACKIKATKEGMVVYASSTDFWQSRRRPIEEGADIHERQKIISIPDMSELLIEIQIHESWVDKIEPNQPAKITADAFPDERFTGRVLKIAPLPSPQAFWMDTGLKVYKTEVVINGKSEILKPGMSAKAEIIADELQDVFCVPVQAVASREGKKFCYVPASDDPEPREVKTGKFNDDFIEIIEGLKEGDKVLLIPPKHFDGKDEDSSEEEKEKEEPNSTQDKSGPEKEESPNQPEEKE